MRGPPEPGPLQRASSPRTPQHLRDRCRLGPHQRNEVGGRRLLSKPRCSLSTPHDGSFPLTGSMSPGLLAVRDGHTCRGVVWPHVLAMPCGAGITDGDLGKGVGQHDCGTKLVAERAQSFGCCRVCSFSSGGPTGRPSGPPCGRFHEKWDGPCFVMALHSALTIACGFAAEAALYSVTSSAKTNRSRACRAPTNSPYSDSTGRCRWERSGPGSRSSTLRCRGVGRAEAAGVPLQLTSHPPGAGATCDLKGFPGGRLGNGTTARSCRS